MELLTNPIQSYAWGSRTAIAAVQGRRPSAQPEAELWMGTHPRASSSVQGRPLGDASGVRLPYLMKLLAAAEPLSIQVHPDADAAAAGFAAEDAVGIPIDDPKRNYVDASHKPELLCAVSEFEALCGFRPIRQASTLLDRLGVPALTEYTALLARDGLAAAVRALLRPDPALRAIAKLAGTACDELAVADPSYAIGADVARRYPGDIGVVLTLLLNYVRLLPGQALFITAGVPHAYLRGTGIEIMASSDNVLRAGLTPKNVDVGEVLRVTRFVETPPELLSPHTVAPGVRQWSPPVREFTLFRVEARPERVAVPAAGPRIVFCLSGALRLATVAGNELELRGGQAAFVAADEGTLTLAQSTIDSVTRGRSTADAHRSADAGDPAIAFVAAPASPAR